MATRKAPGRKAPARKVASIHRTREHKAKGKDKPHVLEDVPPTQPEFDFTMLGEAQLKQANPTPEPSPQCEPARSEKYKPYYPDRPQYEGRDSSIPSDIHINIGRCSISLIFR